MYQKKEPDSLLLKRIKEVHSIAISSLHNRPFIKRIKTAETFWHVLVQSGVIAKIASHIRKKYKVPRQLSVDSDRSYGEIRIEDESVLDDYSAWYETSPVRGKIEEEVKKYMKDLCLPYPALQHIINTILYRKAPEHLGVTFYEEIIYDFKSGNEVAEYLGFTEKEIDYIVSSYLNIIKQEYDFTDTDITKLDKALREDFGKKRFKRSNRPLRNPKFLQKALKELLTIEKEKKDISEFDLEFDLKCDFTAQSCISYL